MFGDRDHGEFLKRDAHFEWRHDGPSERTARARLRSHHGSHVPPHENARASSASSDAGFDADDAGGDRVGKTRISHAFGFSSHARSRAQAGAQAGGAESAESGGVATAAESAPGRVDGKKQKFAFDPGAFSRRDEDEDACHAVSNADVWAEPAVGVTANGLLNKKASATECCAACRDLGDERCNLWTWSPDSRACFLKRGATPYQPLDRRPGIALVAGAIWPEMPKYLIGGKAVTTDTTSKSRTAETSPPACVATMITSNGQPYMNWQTRVFYQTWLEAAKEPGSPLAHFTRILHRTRDDELMREIPTVRIDPTHPECDNGCDYAVKDRARAIARWAATPDARRCSHVLMAEADYLMTRSPPPSVMLQRGHTYGFLFGYIIPWHADAMPASERLADHAFGKDATTPRPAMESVPQSGNAPQVVHVDDLAPLSEAWADAVEFGESDAVVKRVFGWVRDMYAFDFAARKVGVTVHYPPVPLNKLMVQPPADADLGAGCLMHYTWSPILSDRAGKELWRFDKRSFRGGLGSSAHFTVLEQIPLPPAWDASAGFKLQAGEVVTEPGLELMRLMASTFNAGVARLARFPEGTRDAEDVRRVRQEGW